MENMKLKVEHLPTSIKEFFTPEEFAAIPEYEKKHLSSLRQNYEVLRSAGLSVEPPEFMLKKKKKKVVLDLSSDSDDSDSDWTPALEATPRSGERKKTTNVALCHPEMSKEKTKPKAVQVKNRQPWFPSKTAIEKEARHTYPLRRKRVTSYMSLHIPEDDEYLFCEECNIEYIGDCTEHGPLNILLDSQVPPDCLRGKDNDYCKKTLPPGLVIKTSNIPDAGLGVFALTSFPARTRFGPYGGKKEKNEQMAHDSGYCWQIFKDGRPSHFVDASDSSDSNWMRFVNCARCEDEQCVTAYQHKGEIYYRAHRDISAGTEILVYYGDSYARDLGIQVQRVGVVSKNSLTNMENNDCDIYPCQHCRVAFSKLSYLNTHLKYRHGGEGIVSRGLDAIDDTTVHSSSQSSNLHQKQITHIGKKPYKCDKCGKCFVKLGNLKEHHRIHTGEKPYKCHKCGTCFTQPSHLKGHHRIHTGEKPYKCDKCGKCFTVLGSLQRHHRIHTGEKPYKCDKCGKCFTELGTLQRHHRIHTGEKPYKCDKCGQCFTVLSNLQSHNRIHTGEKPYKCDKCGTCFTHNEQLSRHKRTHS
ncbi:histone-lysine N-methyltransferase PRDM9-like [Physella acuta]|uniref:histone-lysine N-methyltransferase PRDM9-like n=1 Tax=Physella acuta TaxID=109671 RepID=UPI0027DD3CBF|nr:histone-lysine N-methyltransferase PRDM9-like [Physella acuta]